MASIQQKRASELAKITAASLKAGELAVLLSEDDKGKLFVGTDGQAGTAVAVRAGHADSATKADAADKLSNAHSFSATGEVTATGVAFDGTGDVALNVTINNGAITNDKLDAKLKKAITDAGTAVQSVTEGTTDGTINVDGDDVKVHGLGSAAYKDTDVFDAAGAADAVKAAVVNTLEAADNSVTVAGSATGKTVAVKLDPDAKNAIKLGTAGLKVEIPDASEYTIVKAADSGDYAAVYNLTKDGSVVGESINIPKDLFVESGEVVVNPDATHEGTFLKLVLQNQTDPIYINVADLVDAYTGSVGDIVTIAISDKNVISATVGNGSITIDKLSAAVQASLGKADTALQKAQITTGKTNGSIAVDGTDVAVAGLKDAAYETKASFNEYADNAATTAANSVKGTASDASSAITVYGARKLADEAKSAADAAQTAADGKVASVVAGDKSITVDATTVTAPKVSVSISDEDGNALKLDTKGLYVATPDSMVAGNGINITGNTISAKVVAANGLSVDATGIKMAVATASVAGTVKGSDEITVTAGVLGFGDVDLGELD